MVVELEVERNTVVLISEVEKIVSLPTAMQIQNLLSGRMTPMGLGLEKLQVLTLIGKFVSLPTALPKTEKPLLDFHF